MKTSQILRDRDLPEYVSCSIGKPDLGSIANRVRELAAVLSAQDCEEVAVHLAQAYGTLLGLMASRK
jgi:hypothetical protein